MNCKKGLYFDMGVHIRSTISNSLLVLERNLTRDTRSKQKEHTKSLQENKSNSKKVLI